MPVVKPYIEVYARTRNRDGRVPLHTAAAVSLNWEDTKLIFMANMPAIYDIDVVTGLPLFMLAAVCLNSDIESAYRLLRDNPFVCSSHVMTE